MVKSTVDGDNLRSRGFYPSSESAILSDHRSGTISRTSKDVGKWNIIRNKICRQRIENRTPLLHLRPKSPKNIRRTAHSSQAGLRSHELMYHRVGGRSWAIVAYEQVGHNFDAPAY